MNITDLKHITVLRAIDQETLETVAAALETIDCPDGQSVFLEGDRGDSMYFIAQGCVRIEKRVQAPAPASKTLAILEAGDYFGEMALLDGKPRSATVVAKTPMRTIRITRTGFNKALDANPTIARGIMAELASRVRRLETPAPD